MKLGAYNAYGYPVNICGKIIQRTRIANGLTQEQLAAKLQIDGIMLSRVQVSKIETGYRHVTDVELAAFTKILGKELMIGFMNELDISLTNIDIDRINRGEGHRATIVAENNK